MGFSSQEYWNGLPFPPLGDLPNPGIELVSPFPPALAGGFFTTSTTWEALWCSTKFLIAVFSPGLFLPHVSADSACGPTICTVLLPSS